MMKTNMLYSFLILVLLSCGKKDSSGGGTQPTETTSQLSINDVNLFEGNSGTTQFEFTVSLDHASSKTITVNYSTTDGTAKSGSDYTAVSNQTLTFQPNETSKTITINVVGDDIEEADDQFNVVLSNPTNATLSKATGVGTIRNEDTKASFNDTGYDAPTSYPGYTLAWSDEFNGNSLDTSAWSFETGNSGWGNNELENYTNRSQNLSLQNGKLVIHALQENYGGSSYTSARIKTQGKKEFKFGRIDIRAILPKGRGVWPALWMLGSNINSVGWPTCGETDIMELLGQDPTKIYGTLHYSTGSAHDQRGSSTYLTSGSFNDQFHVFSIIWKQDQIQFLVDNNPYYTVNRTDMTTTAYPFNAPFFFIFNVAVGGNWPGNPDATTYFPQWMIVDYVRVYQ